ncbi:MAG: FeoA domain-containing protein [Bacillota bacterium]|jgi:ferrous iron transport protein A|nr:FeoA domain-containing protein [Bacillota bacterium]HHU43389.1 hypothetical protein [Clostridiales bacterium]
MAKKTLERLKKGVIGKVIDIKCPNTIKKRLMDMGLCLGAKIEYIGKAPLGDPLLFKVKEILLALRKKVAKDIIVEI